jgi:succinate dehydrogenase / fumarate reductase cytochrome b subunit
MIIVGSHLWHGVSSAFQSLGLDTPAWTRFILPAGKAIAVLIAVGFIVIAVWAHLNGVRS